MTGKLRNVVPKRWTAGAGLSVWILLLVGLAGFLFYTNTLYHDFVFDDHSLIIQNPQVINLQFGEMLSRSGYRPVRTLTYAFNYALGGDNPFGYHLFNVVLHALNGLLVCGILWLWTGSRVVAAVGALVFVLHPAQTAAVAYISGRKDLLALFFVLIGCYLFTAYRRSRRNGLAAASLAAFGLGILSKEVAIVFPALLLLMDALVLTPSVEEQSNPAVRVWQAVRRSPGFYGAFLLLSGLGLYYALFITKASRMVGFWGGSFESNLGTSFKLFQHYVQLALFPYPLIADYSGTVFPVSSGFGDPATLLAVVFLVAYLGTAWWLARRSRLSAFGMLWFLVGLLPVLQIIPFHELAMDHFLYLPLFGFALVGGVLSERLVRSKEWNVVAWAGVSLVLIVFSLSTWDRNRDWKNSQTIWEATLESAPNSYRANTNLAALYRGQDPERSIALTKKSIELDPQRPTAWANLGGLYFDVAENLRNQRNPEKARQNYEESLKYLEEALKLDPDNAFTLSNIGDSYKGLALIEVKDDPDAAGRLREKSKEYFQRALRHDSGNPYVPLIWYKAAMVRVDGREWEAALEHLQRALASFPDLAQANYWAAYCHLQLGEVPAALPFAIKAAKLDPSFRPLELQANVYEELGDLPKAVESHLAALRASPKAGVVHYNLGVLYHRMGEMEKARSHLVQALELEPSAFYSQVARRLLNLIQKNVSES